MRCARVAVVRRAATATAGLPHAQHRQRGTAAATPACPTPSHAHVRVDPAPGDHAKTRESAWVYNNKENTSDYERENARELVGA